MKKPAQSTAARPTQPGFTIIEVMLAVAISALMLIGVIGGVYVSIGQQRYSDALRDFAEYMRTIYSEAISPQSFGIGNSMNEAVIGKVLAFGIGDDNKVYSATIVGNANYSTTVSVAESFLDTLTKDNSDVKLICGNNSGQGSTVQEYTPLWQAKLTQANDGSGNSNNQFRGTMIIARSLTSAVVHTVFLDNNPEAELNLRDNCQPNSNSAGEQIQSLLDNNQHSLEASLERPTGICIKIDGNAVSREVQIAANGRNTSAVKVLDEENSRCR